MGKIRNSRPSPTIVVAALALVGALAGTAIAGPGTTTSALTKSKVKKIATKQINKLAPGIADQQITTRAPGLSVARAATADTAANADALEGKPASAFASSESEPYHEVGTPGEPAFQNDWENGGGSFSTVAFYKDPLGVVHLKGNIFNGTTSNTLAFTLPPGYRPDQQLVMPAAETSALGAALFVEPDGDVFPLCEAAGECDLGMDGLTFRVP